MAPENTVECRNCGYNLQGLTVGASCPECGENQRVVHGDDLQEEDGRVMRMINANIGVKDLAPLPDIRVRLKYWMKLGGLFVCALFFLQLLVTFALIPIGLYRLSLFGLSIFWPAVVIGMMPAKVDASMPPIYKWIRLVVPYTQWCWAAGYVFWLMFHVPFEEYTLGGNLRYFELLLLLHAVAGIGVAGVAFWLHDLALRLDLITAAKRCNAVTVAIFTIGFLVFVLPWKHFAAAGLTAVQGGLMWWAYILVLMLPWLWCVSLFARALFEFSSDASWSLKYDADIDGRQERISKKRKEYEQKRGW
jgi:hypothetical protein